MNISRKPKIILERLIYNASVLSNFDFKDEARWNKLLEEAINF